MKLTGEDVAKRLAAMVAASSLSLPAGSAEKSGASATSAAHGDGWLSDDEYAKLSRDEREELAKKRGAKKLAELAYADFRDWLAGLSSVAGRNCALMEGARRARRAGVDCETFVAETVEAGGEPPLSAGEVRRAYERCKAEPIATDGVAVRVPFPRPPKPKPRPPSEEERGYVRRMIETGERLLSGWNGKASALLVAASPVAIPTDARGRAVVQLRALFGKLSGAVFLGGKYDARKSATMKPLDVWTAEIERGAEIPPMVGIHTFTGEGVEVTDERTGERVLSYRRSECVTAWRYALVEFDALTLTKQVAFWLGVLATRSLDVRTVTFTGGKSLHGIIRLAGDGSRATYDRIWGKLAKCEDGQRDEERTTWGTLSRLLCSDREAVEETGANGKARTTYTYCADFAASAVLISRLAGCPAHEETKPNGERKSYREAVLLWVAEPDGEDGTKTDAPAATVDEPEPFAERPAVAVTKYAHEDDAAVIEALRFIDRPHNSAYDWDYVALYMKATGIIPDWLTKRMKAERKCEAELLGIV